MRRGTIEIKGDRHKVSLSVIAAQGQNRREKSPWVFGSKLGFHSGHVARRDLSVPASEGENM